MLVQTNMGPLPYEAIVAQINARYAEGKTPDLAVKSALQLGIDPAIIATLPGVDENAMRRGMQLISSGAFEESATGTQADIQTAAPIGSAQYNARKAAGLDAFGFPPEEVAQLIAAGLYGPGRQFDPGDMAQPAQNFSGLFSSGNVLEDQAQQVLAASGKANDPRFADAIVGSFVQDGVTYNVQGDGSIQGIIETPTGAYLAGGFTPTGQQATEQLSTQFEETDLDRALGILANAAIAAGTGFALGPAGVGALGVPGAAAAGAGLTNLVNTADLESALRAAALGGLTAYGVQSLFPGAGVTAPVDDFLAADVAQLAAQGIPEDQIAQILTQEGVSSNVISAALDAQFGTSAPGSAKGLGTPSMPSGAEQVAVTGQNVSNLGALSSLAPALATFAPTQTLPSIQVTGQTVKPDLTVPEAVSAALPVVSGGTVQQVGVTGQTIPKTEPVAPTAAAVGAIVPGIQPAVPSAAEQVQVTGKKETPANITVPTLSAALPAIPAAVTATLPKPTQPPAKKEDSLFTPSDILKLLTLLGGTAAAGGAGTGTVPVGSIPPSDARLGSTTPQFGDDYYAAVQRYYNAFMPETPRDVATPLRAWYENTGMSPAASGGTFAPGSVVGGLFGGRSTLPSGPTMRPQSAVGMPTTTNNSAFISSLQAANLAAGIPENPANWTIQDRIKAAEIQNQQEGRGEFGRLVVNPETGVTSRTPVQMFSTLPQDQKAIAESYLSSVVPVVAERSLQSGAGWGDFYGLSNQYRVSPEELLNFMTPEQRKSFEDRFSYQVGKNDRLFSGDTSFLTSPSATFSPETPEYLRQAATFLPNASPEVRKRLEQALYAGTAIGNLGETPLLPEEYGSFGVPWWQTPPTLALGIAGVSSGDPLQFYRQQALQQAQSPLSNIFADAGRRSNYGSIGGFDVTASRDNTPYIEDINLYGDRPVSRLKEKYGLSDDQISELLNLVPSNSLILGTDNFGRPVYPGEIGEFIKQRKRTPGGGFTGQEIYDMVREGLPKP